MLPTKQDYLSEITYVSANLDVQLFTALVFDKHVAYRFLSLIIKYILKMTHPSKDGPGLGTLLTYLEENQKSRSFV